MAISKNQTLKENKFNSVGDKKRRRALAKNRIAFIMTKAEAVIPKKGEGHPNQKTYAFLRPDTSLPPVGKSPSMSIDLALNNIQPGGGIEEHYHEYDKEMPIFDHLYYVISGRIKATIGDTERTVGADSLIYCPSDQRHSITNVGKGLAKILRISGCNEGAKMGGPVWSKMPSGDLKAHSWKLAGMSGFDHSNQ